MKQAIRNEHYEIIGYYENWSETRDILRDKNQKKIGVYEKDTKVTRDGQLQIVGYGENQLMRLVK